MDICILTYRKKNVLGLKAALLTLNTQLYCAVLITVPPRCFGSPPLQSKQNHPPTKSALHPSVFLSCMYGAAHPHHFSFSLVFPPSSNFNLCLLVSPLFPPSFSISPSHEALLLPISFSSLPPQKCCKVLQRRKSSASLTFKAHASLFFFFSSPSPVEHTPPPPPSLKPS